MAGICEQCPRRGTCSQVPVLVETCELEEAAAQALERTKPPQPFDWPAEWQRRADSTEEAQQRRNEAYRAHLYMAANPWTGPP